MVWIDDRQGMNTQEAIKACKKMADCAYAYGYNVSVTGNCSHAEGYNTKAIIPKNYAEGESSLCKVQPIKLEYKYQHKVEEVDVLEKIQKEIEEWLKNPGVNCQANIVDKQANLLNREKWRVCGGSGPDHN